MFRKIVVCLIAMIVLTGCGAKSTETEKRNTQVEVISSLTVKSADEFLAELYLDGEIKLRVKESEATLTESPSKDINVLKQQYGLFDAGDGIIGIVFEDQTAVRPFIILDLFLYKENRLSKIYSSRDIIAKIQNISNNDEGISLSLPNYNASSTLDFTDPEFDRWKQKKSELASSGIQIDTNYCQDIQDDLIFSPTDYFIENADEQGNRRLLILSDVYTVGAKTPTIRDRAIIEFVMAGEAVGYADIMFERDAIGDHSLFDNFN